MNESYWLLSSKSKKYKVLDEDISTDYLIVGGGIVGLTTAFLLAKEKLSVTLLDADRIGYGLQEEIQAKLLQCIILMQK